MSLSAMSGESVELDVLSLNAPIILYFSGDIKDMERFSALNRAMQTSGVIAYWIIPQNTAQSGQVPKAEFPSKIVIDDKNLVLTYGLSWKAPAAVVIGPDNILLSILEDPKDETEIILAAYDVFLANGLISTAKGLSRGAFEPFVQDSTVLPAYEALLDGDTDSARTILDSLRKKDPSSADINLATAYLLYQEGNFRDALGECKAARNDSFGTWVDGMILSRTGECDAAASSFARAAARLPKFRWQQVLILNSAARTAESKPDKSKALSLYKQAFELAPLNSVTTGNLLTYYWEEGKTPTAAAYVPALKWSGNSNVLVQSLLSTFAEDIGSASSEGRRENRKIDKTNNSSQGTKFLVIPDFSMLGCPFNMNWLDRAAAGYLATCLDKDSVLTPIIRSEIVTTAKALKIPQSEINDSARLKQLADALSADFLVLGEMANLSDFYLMNVRVADAKTGEIVALASERFQSTNATASVIEKAAASLLLQLSKSRSNPKPATQ